MRALSPMQCLLNVSKLPLISTTSSKDARCYTVLITKQGMASSANFENEPCRDVVVTCHEGGRCSAKCFFARVVIEI